MEDKRDAETEQARTMLLCYLHTPNPPCPPLTASLRHCRQWGEGGIAVFYTKTLINIVLMGKQLMHVLGVWDHLD
eukprot:8908563-Ditylum_brightwellii.AAC.1